MTLSPEFFKGTLPDTNQVPPAGPIMVITLRVGSPGVAVP